MLLAGVKLIGGEGKGGEKGMFSISNSHEVENATEIWHFLLNILWNSVQGADDDPGSLPSAVFPGN